MSQILDRDPSGDVPMTREELEELVASTICCHTRMSPAVEWEINVLMGAIEKHVQLRLLRAHEACAKTAPTQPVSQAEDVAFSKGWNDAMDTVVAALVAGSRP